MNNGFDNCYFCGKKHWELLGIVEGQNLTRCKECRFIQVNPLPPREEYIKLYKNLEYHSHRMDENRCRKPWERLDHDYKLAQSRLDIIEKLKRKGKLLDIGASNGSLVKAANDRGFEAEGTELDDFICKFAEVANKVKMHCGELKDLKFPDRYFDVVTAHDVIEHLYSPREELEEIYRILKPNGLLVLDTPNMDVFSLAIDGLQWHHIKPKEHIFYLSDEHLRKILADQHFKIECVRHPIEGKSVFYAFK